MTKATECFDAVSQRLRMLTVENQSFEKLIPHYDGPGTLFFCDPPYLGTEGHYDDVFTKEQHLTLRDLLAGIRGKFILTYNDHPWVRELYQQYTILPVERKNGISYKAGISKEVIIKNFEAHHLQDNRERVNTATE